MDNFAVVEFCDENAIGVVPKSWIDESESQVTICLAFTFTILIILLLCFSCIFTLKCLVNDDMYIACMLLSNDYFITLCMKMFVCPYRNVCSSYITTDTARIISS